MMQAKYTAMFMNDYEWQLSVKPQSSFSTFQFTELSFDFQTQAFCKHIF